MKKIQLLWSAAFMFAALSAGAQIVTTSPAILQENSKDVVLTYHADSPLGNNGMKDLPQSTQVYAHIGVITSKSVNTSDWKYTVTPWPQSDGSNSQAANLDKNRLKYVSPNTYTLTIGDIRSYFGITDASEKIEKLAMVFRGANGSPEGKSASGGDIFVDVAPAGFAMTMTCDAASTILSQETEVTFTVNSSEPAALELSVDGTPFASNASATVLTGKYTFSKKGSFNVVGKAVYGGKTYTETINIAYPGASEAGTYPGGVPRMGAVKNSDGTVTFCLAAPGKTSVVLVPSWDNYEVLDRNMMKYQDYQGNRYFWTTVSGLKDDQWYPYYYVVDGTTKVADPYAELVLDCYSDKWLDPSIWPDMPKYPYEKFDGIMLAVYRGDLHNYKFSPFTIPDHDKLVIYEMLFRDFTGTEGEANGNGTVRQAMAKIPYLKELGVNAVELMPIMEFNGNNSWGYNTNFYMAPDKAYGSPKDYKDFIDACHRNGIAVILDIVFNQSDGLHPWYQMYPIASNPFYNEIAPHAYSVLNDWNQDNALVQQQWTDAVTYWMKNYNVDGYRFDLVKGLGNNDSYGNGTDGYNASRVERMKRIHGVIKSVKPNGIHINENLAGAQEEIQMGNDGELQWANINNNSCQYVMGFAPSSGAKISAFLSTLQENRPWGSTVSYAESHDEERMAYKAMSFGANNVKGNRTNVIKRAGSLAVQMLMTPGPKMIWQFGELGADQTTKAGASNNTDPKIVIWSRLDDPEYKGLHDVYMAMCRTRVANPELFSEDTQFATSGLDAAINATRYMRLTAGGKEMMAFFNSNISGGNRTIGAPATVLSPENSQLICATPGLAPTLIKSGSSVGVALPPHSFAVFATKDVTGNEEVETGFVSPSVNVYSNGGEIVIDGEYDNVSVYSVSGQQQSSLRVAPGIYIVNVDGEAHKVVVR